MEPTPKVSVSILTHNYARYLPDAIRSVLSQSFQDFELLLCDDASTDDTASVVAPYLADARIRYIRHEANLGQAGNWAFALAGATAPILAVLHADDYWVPGTLQRAIDAFERDHSLDVYHGNYVYRREPVGEIATVPALGDAASCHAGLAEYARQARRNTYIPSATFVTRRVVQQTAPPDSRLQMLVDYEYFLRVAARSRTVCFDPNVLTIYRVHPASTTSITHANGRLARETVQFAEICQQHGRDIPELKQHLGAIQHTMAMSLYSLGVSQAVNGNWSTGVNLLRQAPSLKSRLWASPKYLLDRLLTAPGHLARPIFLNLHRSRLER